MERKTADEYPQELLDLFHEYQHGDMDRRSFMNTIAKFAVGGLTVAAIFDSLTPNYAWAQTIKPDDPEIKVGYETVGSPEGNGSIKGYLARPAKGKKFPAVLVIHENRGLNPYIEDVARRLAKAGYMAFAPDGLTSVGGYPGDDQKGAAAFRAVDGKKMTEDFVAAAKWLKARPDSTGKLGAVGFCFGGGMVNQLAVRLGKDLDEAAWEIFDTSIWGRRHFTISPSFAAVVQTRCGGTRSPIFDKFLFMLNGPEVRMVEAKVSAKKSRTIEKQ